MSELDLNALTDPKVFNREFLLRLENPTEEGLKKAASATSQMLRTQIREDGFLRKILPPIAVTKEDLHREFTHDRPVMMDDMEPNSVGAVTLPFNVSADAAFFTGRKFKTEFFTIRTRKFTKSIFELMTATQDLRKIISENSVRDTQTEEDSNFINLCDLIVGPTPNVPATMSKVIQYHEINSGITRTTYPEIKKFLERNRVNNGVFLMNNATSKEFEKWDRNEIGGDLAENIYKDGLSAQGASTHFGVPHIYTQKDEMVPDGVLYLFTEPNFLGRFYTLKDATMYIERKEDQVTFSASECIGLSIANVVGVHKVVFTG